MSPSIHPRRRMPAAAGLALAAALVWPAEALAGWRCRTLEARAGAALPGHGGAPTGYSGGAALPPPNATDTCWGPQASHRVVGEHVVVEYDDSGLLQEALQLRAALDEAYGVLVDDLGWPELRQHEDYLLVAYIASDISGAAYTARGTCPDGSWMPYIVVASDVFDDAEWVEDMAAHELNHAQQYSLEVEHEDWWWEATATWVQSQVHPRHRGWLDYVDRGYLAQPQLAMAASDRSLDSHFAHMYGMALFAAHLEERVGGASLVRRTWTAFADVPGTRPGPMAEVLEALGEDFEGVYRGFVVSVATTRWDHAASMGELAVARTVTSLPAEGESEDAWAPESLGQAFIRVQVPAPAAETPDLGLVFEGEAGAGWRVFLVGGGEGGPDEVVEIEVTENTGVGQLPALGDYDAAWLIATPTASGGGRWAFSYALSAVEALPDTGGVDSGLDEDTGRGDTGPDRPDEESDVGDAPLRQPQGRCQSGGGPAGAVWMLGLGLAWMRRRRPVNFGATRY